MSGGSGQYRGEFTGFRDLGFEKGPFGPDSGMTNDECPALFSSVRLVQKSGTVHRVATETSYSDARQHLAALLDRAVDDRETIIITRRNGARVALLAADELASYEEAAYLLRSPPNARRLLDALRESLADEVVPFDFAELRARLERAVSREGE